MDRIRTLVATVRRRLLLEAWLSSALHAGVVAAALLLALVLERRITGGTARLGLPSGWDGVAVWLALTFGLLAAASAFGVWRARRAVRNEASAALELDARLATGERFTTALELETATDPFARAAVADAVQYAQAPAVAEAVRERFAVKPPVRWWLTPTILTVALLAWLVLPQLALFGAPDVQRASADANAPRVPTTEEKRLEELLKTIKESPALAKALDAELEKAQRTLDQGADTRKPEEAARESLRRMAELQARLDEMKDSKQNQTAQALQDALSKLELPKDNNAARDLAESLKRGDFAEAKKAVESLQNSMKEGNLSEEQKAALSKALDDTAKQLETLSKDPQKMADALKNAGMDPSLAQNTEALKQAIQQNQSMNQTQKEALQKMADSIQQSQQQLGKMSQQMSKMATACKNPGDQGQSGQQSQQAQGQSGKPGAESQSGQQGGSKAAEQAGEQMSQMLSQSESDQMMQQAAKNAESQCNGGNAMSEAEADSALKSSCRGDGEGNGNGAAKDNNKGGRGTARGGNREMKQTAFGTKTQKQKGPRGDGDVIARQLVEGQSPVGESRVGLEAVATKIAGSYERGADDDLVPAHLRGVHQRYFGELGRKLEERGVKATPPAGAAPAPAAPTGGAK